jgi:hypothetical protein
MQILKLFPLKYLLLVSLFSCLSSNSWSEIYQWTDENGQTHFGDRAPNTSAKEISKQVNQINITRNLSSPEMMLRHEQAKDAERKKQYEQWQEKIDNQPSKDEKCEEFKKLLNIVKGRVVFVDEHGKDLNVTETERRKRARQLEDAIRKHCH